MAKSLILALLSIMFFTPPAVCHADGPVMLSYHGAAQFDIRTSSGHHVFIDVSSPDELTAEPTAKDILLTTHRHPDHLDRDFQSNFPGKQLLAANGVLASADVRVTGIVSIHHPGDSMATPPYTNVIYLIETGGLRIAHLGDIGQRTFTEKQMQQLAGVDIVITQFANDTLSAMTVENGEGFRLAQHLSPRLIIPTSHTGLAALEKARTLWPCYATDAPFIVLERAALPATPRFLLLGDLAEIAVNELDFRRWLE